MHPYKILAAAVLAAAPVASADLLPAVSADALAPVASTSATTAQVVGLDSAGGTGSLVSSPTVVYETLSTAAQRGFTSGDANAYFGDSILLADTGRLDTFRFAAFNGGSSSGPLTTATYEFLFFDNASFTAGDYSTGLIGGFTGNIDFRDPSDPLDTGLDPGFFSRRTFTGLSGLTTPIDLLTDTIVITQRLIASTGGADNFGVIDFAGPSIGAAATQLYIDASTINAGTPGFYGINDGPGTPSTPFSVGYDVTVAPIPEPATAGLLGLGSLALLRRRKA